jgi:hypothetical protein
VGLGGDGLELVGNELLLVLEGFVLLGGLVELGSQLLAGLLECSELGVFLLPVEGLLL